MTSPDERIEQRARALYQQAGDTLDPAMARRLRTARRDALQQPARTSLGAARLLVPAVAFAAVALAALMVWQPYRDSAEPARQVAPAASRISLATDDSELPPDADSADPNLYQNLDFYGWLAANDAAPPARRGP